MARNLHVNVCCGSGKARVEQNEQRISGSTAVGNDRYNGSGNGNGNGHADGNGGGPPRLEILYGEQLSEIRAAERQAVALFPDLAVAAGDREVVTLLRSAAAETQVQLARLDRLVRGLALPSEPDRTAPAGYLANVRSILDGEHRANGNGNGNGRNGSGGGEALADDVDDALLRSAQQSLRYQIAGYESACATARRLGDYQRLDTLLQSLDEELARDSALSRIVSHRSAFLRTS